MLAVTLVNFTLIKAVAYLFSESIELVGIVLLI